MNMTATGILLVLLLAGAGMASADELSADSANTMSCGSNFVSVGDTEDAVLSTCGEPSFRDGNRWTYSDRPGSFIYELSFGGGRILSIHTRASE
jgi:hypothetical protein